MRSRSEQALLVLALIALVLLVPALPARAELVQSDYVLVRQGDVVPEDLYAAGNSVTIAGTVDGDLVAAAFEEIRIEGHVTGSVDAVASRVVVTGTVDGSVRAATGSVDVTGTIGKDLLVGANRVVVEKSGKVGRDAVVWARSADVAGTVGRNLQGRQGLLRLSGTVNGDVDVTVNRIEATGAVVAGDLAYRSGAPGSVDATVGGSLVHQRPLPPNVRLRAIRLLAELLAVLIAVGLGLSFLWAMPARAGAAIEAVLRRTGRSLLRGLAVVAIPVVLAALVAVAVAVSPPAAGLPLLLVFLPVLLGVFGLLALAALVAPIPTAAALGGLVLRGRSPFAAFLLGCAIWGLLLFVPWVGLAVTVVGVVLGLGAWLGPVSGGEAGAPAEDVVEAV